MYNNKTFNKIYLKIDSIAKEGSLGQINYNQYINELIDAGQFYIFRDVLDRKYGIPSSQQMTVTDIKNNTFDKIRFQTTSVFQESLQSLYIKYSVYQMGIDVYRNGTDLSLGNIKSTLSVSSTVVPTGVTSSNSLNGIPTITSLSVLRSDNVLLNLDDPSTELISKYESAIQFLLGYVTTTTTTTTTTSIPTTTSTTTTTTTVQIIANNVYQIKFNTSDGSGNIYGWQDDITACGLGPSTSNTFSLYSESNNFVEGINVYADSNGTPLTTVVDYNPYRFYYLFTPFSTYQRNTFNITSGRVVNLESCFAITTTSTTTTTTTTNIVLGGSLQFDGITQQYLGISASSDFAPGTGDFTVEWFQNQNEEDPYPRAWTIGQSPAPFGVSVENGEIYTWINGVGYPASMSSWENIWIHLAICRYSGTVSVYQNGVGLTSFSNNDNINDTSDELLIGIDSLYPTITRFSGDLTNFHFVNGTSLYTSDFTPPSSPISPVANTKLLLLATSSSTAFVDSSGLNKNVTNVLGVTWSTNSPF
jgi:hypothetical protein